MLFIRNFPLLACDLRIIKPFATILFHQYSTEFNSRIKFKALRRFVFTSSLEYESFKNFVSKHTKLTETQIKNLLRSDRYLSPTQCLKFGIVDEIFATNKMKKLVIDASINDVREVMIDTFITDLPILIRPEKIRELHIKSVTVYNNNFNIDYGTALKYINLMLEVQIPITFISISDIENGKLLMNLFANESYLVGDLSKAIFNPVHFLGVTYKYNNTMEDNIHNMTYYRQLITNILRTKTKLPEEIIKTFHSKEYSFTAEQSKKYKLFDHVVDIKDKAFTMDDNLNSSLLGNSLTNIQNSNSNSKSKKTTKTKSKTKSIEANKENEEIATNRNIF